MSVRLSIVSSFIVLLCRYSVSVRMPSGMKSFRPAGGWKQRRERSHAAAGEVRQSRLASWLVEMWCWGLFSAQTVQKIAQLSADDINQLREALERDLEGIEQATQKGFSELDALAAIGDHGRNPNTCHRDLVRKLTPHALPSGYSFYLPLKVSANVWKNVLQVMMLPHVWFSCIYHHYPRAWKDRIVRSAARLKQFWRDVRSEPVDPLFVGHPVASRHKYDEFCVPITIHSDEVPVVGVGKCWSKSMLIFSWSSLLGSGATKETNYFVWGIFEAAISKLPDADTLDKFWKTFCWSLVALWHGKWPSHSPERVLYPSASEAGRKAGTQLARRSRLVAQAVRLAALRVLTPMHQVRLPSHC